MRVDERGEPVNITLDANPSDAPCCLKIIADDGRDMLVQTDWDYPATARTFGWDMSTVQNAPKGYSDWQEGYGEWTAEEETAFNAFGANPACEHSHTDGTVDCKECGLTAHEFIAAARQWLDDNDGAEAEDPGYFDNE